MAVSRRFRVLRRELRFLFQILHLGKIHNVLKNEKVEELKGKVTDTGDGLGFSGLSRCVVS